MEIENWCPVCDKRIDDLEEEDEDEMDMDNLPPSMQDSSSRPTLPIQHKSSKSKSGHPRQKPHPKKNHSSARLASKGLSGKAHQSHKSLEPSKPTEEEVAARDRWKGYYCSVECMKADELSSRLALSNLSSSSMPFPSTSQYRRPSSNSSRGYSSDDLPSPTMLPGRHLTQSGDKLNDYFSQPGSAYSTIRRNGRPSALGLGAHNSKAANDWGSSDSLASRNSPHDASYSVSRSSKSGLRAMTPIHSTFSQADVAMARSTSVESQLRMSSSDDDSANHQITHPKAAKASPYPMHSKSRSLSTNRSGIMPASSTADPVLSQGAEGNAYGTVFSRSFTSSEYQMQRPKIGRHSSSSASIPHLSCSPSSQASSTWSSRSTYSTNSSNAPSDGYASKSEHFNGHHRNRSSLSVPFISASQRTPSLTAIPSYFSRSPPTRSGKISSTSFSDSQGTISRIIHEKAAQKYNKASSPPTGYNHHPQFDDSGLYPAIPASSPGEATPTQSEGHLKRIGSNASVASLPHYFTANAKEVEPIPSRGSMANLASSGTSPASTGRGWNWDPSMAQYTAMRKKGDGEEGKRKRLFFWDTTQSTQN